MSKNKSIRTRQTCRCFCNVDFEVGVRQSSATGELSNSIRTSFNPGRLLVLLGTGRINHRGRNTCYAPTQRRSLVSPSKRFSELQDEFFATSKRLRLARTEMNHSKNNSNVRNCPKMTDTSRLSRYLIDSLSIFKRLQFAGIQVVLSLRASTRTTSKPNSSSAYQADRAADS